MVYSTVFLIRMMHHVTSLHRYLHLAHIHLSHALDTYKQPMYRTATHMQKFMANIHGHNTDSMHAYVSIQTYKHTNVNTKGAYTCY